MAPNPEAGHPRRMPGDILDLQRHDDAAGRAWLLINCGVVLISVAGSAIIHSAVDSTTTSATGGLMACPLLVAFLLYLLGLWLVMVALVADLFPPAERVGAAVARALRQYLLGLGR
ncbi:unnamed protein product [Urochloa humidicola]